MSFVCREAVERILKQFPADTCFVCANGYISREAFNVDDQERLFYMLGSMGLGGSIALGAALAQPERKVAVLDGDGNVLMGLGALALIGAQKPKNLYHLVLDNGAYASTGNQPTISRQVSLEGIAREAGYVAADRADTPAELDAKLSAQLQLDGPTFLRVMIDTEPHPKDFPRVNHTPEEITARFSRALQGRART